MVIEKTKKVYLKDEEYIRVFFEGSEYFHDVPTEIYAEWKEALGHEEKK